jgi:hypothetical protein
MSMSSEPRGEQPWRLVIKRRMRLSCLWDIHHHSEMDPVASERDLFEQLHGEGLIELVLAGTYKLTAKGLGELAVDAIEEADRVGAMYER